MWTVVGRTDLAIVRRADCSTRIEQDDRYLGMGVSFWIGRNWDVCVVDWTALGCVAYDSVLDRRMDHACEQ